MVSYKPVWGTETTIPQSGFHYRTDVRAVRKIKADFNVIVMEPIAHYPMHERTEEFNRHVEDVGLEPRRVTHKD